MRVHFWFVGSYWNHSKKNPELIKPDKNSSKLTLCSISLLCYCWIYIIFGNLPNSCYSMCFWSCVTYLLKRSFSVSFLWHFDILFISSNYNIITLWICHRIWKSSWCKWLALQVNNFQKVSRVHTLIEQMYVKITSKFFNKSVTKCDSLKIINLYRCQWIWQNG